MSKNKVNNFFTYRLLESKIKSGLFLNEDDTEDLPDDITKNSPSSDKKQEDNKKDTKSINPKVNMALDITNKSNESSYRSYVTLFVEALNSLDAIAALASSVDPDAPGVKNYKTERYDIATSVDKSAKGLKKAWDKLYSIAGPWPPSGSGLTSVVQNTLKKDDVYKKYFAEKKLLDDQLNGTPKMKQEVYDEELANLKKKYSEMIDPKRILTLSKINTAISLYKKAIDNFRQGADVELGFIEKREGGISASEIDKINDVKKIINSDKASPQEKIKEVEKLQKDYPAFFGNVDKEALLKGGIEEVISSLENSAPEDFYEKVSDSISNIVLSKDPSSKKQESDSSFSDSEYILEDFGGVVNTAKLFTSGVGKGIIDGFKGGPKDSPVQNNDKASLVYSAEGIRGNLISLASEIDNVINFKKNLQGLPNKTEGKTQTEKSAESTAEEAKSEASEMISFVQDSFKYVNNIRKEIESSTISAVKSKLEDISKQISIITRKGGILDKWKDDVLGSKRERVATTAYLEKGRSLMQMAAAKAAEVSNQEKIDKRIKDREADKVINKVIDTVTNMGNGGSGSKPSLIKKRSDVVVFSKDEEKPNAETVKTFQQRLINLGHLPTGNPNGEFDEDTKAASRKAMNYIGNLTGKVYADTDEAFQDFQRDLGYYNDNQATIRKSLGF